MSEEEILADNIEVITKQGINKENLDICMIYGISGNCGKRCPKFKDRTCEEYLTTLENEYKSDELEIERLNNIIKDVLKRQKEALKYIGNFLSMDDRYKHGNGNDQMKIVRNILNKHNEELKGVGKE